MSLEITAADLRSYAISSAALSDYDDELAEDYLEGNDISSERLQSIIRKATLDIAIFPVMCGSSFKNKGVQPLLDAVVAYLPSPLDVPPMEGIVPATKHSEETREVRTVAADLRSVPTVW